MKSFLKVFFAATLGGVFAIVLYTQFAEAPTILADQSANPRIQFSNYNAPSPAVPLESIDFVKASKMTVDAVVHVKTTFQPQKYYNPWSQFFGGSPYYSQEQKAAGSGVIISPDGYIVTNNHVIQNASKIEITTNGNRTYEAKLIGADPATDLALLKIEVNNMPAIVLGDSDNLQIGEWVLAVGNPFNLTSTVTAGIVSAKARNINILDYNPENDIFPLESFIQTDAAVNPGNSGGALVNGIGELVGINTAIASQTGSYSGYSFAVPVSIVQKVITDILEFGKVQRAYIGVNIADVDGELAAQYKLDRNDGALVRGLVEGGAAADAGLKEGDLITNVQGIAVKNVTQLQEQVGKFRPGDKIDITVQRGRESKDLTVTLRDRSGSTELQKRSEEPVKSTFGIKVQSISEDEMRKLNVKNGVRITSIDDTRLRKAGLKEGFVITHIDKQAISTPEELTRMLQAKRGGILVEGVHANGMPDYFGFGL